MRPLIDAHLDLAWNALSFNRDLTLSLERLNDQEQHMTDVACRGHATTTLPELQRAGVAVCVATLLARGGPDQPAKSSYGRTDLDYATPSIAHAAAQGQLAYYQLLESQGHLRRITSAEQLDAHWQKWQANERGSEPIGIILSMEGADPVVDSDRLGQYWDQGLRAVGLAHYGRSHYAHGTGTHGPLTERGIQLLREMDRLAMVLDVTHLCDESLQQAIDLFPGIIVASHHNCRALVPGDRQLTDAQIRQIAQRDGVIGAALDAWMLRPGWIRGSSTPGDLTLAAVADHTDHICQLVGNTRHVAIGSDLDGGFGTEQTPGDVKTIADVRKLESIYQQRGYSEADIDAIFYGNWLRLFRAALTGRGPSG